MISHDVLLGVAIVVGTAFVNGAVTWGIIQARLDGLADGVKEAKGAAASAHHRIDSLLGHARR